MTKSEILKENETIKITLSIESMISNLLRKDTLNFEDIYKEDLKTLLVYVSDSKLFDYSFNENDIFSYDEEYPKETFRNLQELEEELLSKYTTNKFIIRTFQ